MTNSKLTVDCSIPHSVDDSPPQPTAANDHRRSPAASSSFPPVIPRADAGEPQAAENSSQAAPMKKRKKKKNVSAAAAVLRERQVLFCQLMDAYCPEWHGLHDIVDADAKQAEKEVDMRAAWTTFKYFLNEGIADPAFLIACAGAYAAANCNSKSQMIQTPKNWLWGVKNKLQLRSGKQVYEQWIANAERQRQLSPAGVLESMRREEDEREKRKTELEARIQRELEELRRKGGLS